MNDYGSGSNFGPRGQRRGRGGSRYGRPDSGARGRADSRNGVRHDARGGARQTNRARQTRRECPEELREPFLEARDFLAGLIGALGLPARLSFGGVEPARDGRQVTIDVRALHPPAPERYNRSDEIPADDLGILIGKHGAMLDALTAIVNAVMHRGESEGLFFAVDVEGYRSRRVATLRSIAQRGADRALREGVAIELAPMPPSERRIVHLTLATHARLATESTGTGANRRVVIVPKNAPPVDYGPEDDEEPEY